MANKITKRDVLRAKKSLEDYIKSCEKFIDLRSKIKDLCIDGNKSVVVAEKLDCDLKRIFNNGTTTDGGRLYGADYQLLSEDERANILINGELTVELDYGTLHISMLYHLKGIDFKGDAYSLGEYEPELKSMLNDENKLRQVVKKAVNIIINASNIVNAKESLKKALKNQDIVKPKQLNKFCKQIIDAITEKHEAIKEFFFSKKGIMLQRIDSDIAFGIIEELMKRQILVLPIHDSFIVQRRYEQKLRDAMIRHYKAKFNYQPTIK